jgi:hypothetical protein
MCDAENAQLYRLLVIHRCPEAAPGAQVARREGGSIAGSGDRGGEGRRHGYGEPLTPRTGKPRGLEWRVS